MTFIVNQLNLSLSDSETNFNYKFIFDNVITSVKSMAVNFMNLSLFFLSEEICQNFLIIFIPKALFG